MERKASITALMSSFGRAFHAEHEEHPVFADHLARALMTDEEYAAVMRHIEANNKPWDADDEDSEEEYLAFCDCEDLQDLYDRVLAATEAQIRAELEEENEEARRLYGEAAHLHGNGEDVLAYYNVGVNFEYSD